MWSITTYLSGISRANDRDVGLLGHGKFSTRIISSVLILEVVFFFNSFFFLGEGVGFSCSGHADRSWMNGWRSQPYGSWGGAVYQFGFGIMSDCTIGGGKKVTQL